MKGALFALLLILPSPACAERLPGQEYNFLSSFVQMIAALSIVIGLILVARHFSERVLKSRLAGSFGTKHIRLVETRPIAPRKSLILIEVGGEYLLLSCTENQLSLIKQVEIYEEIEVVDGDAGDRSGLLGFWDRYKGRRRG